MCPREQHTRQHGIMDTAAYSRSIDEVAAMGATQVVLTGFGEPMLDVDLSRKIRYATGAGLRTYIISNASALTEAKATDLLRAGLGELRVSFYGMRPETYGAVMWGLDYQRATDNLHTFLRVRAEMGAACKLQLSYLVLPENAADVDAFREYWEPRADAIEIWRPHNFGDGRHYRKRTLTKRSCGRPDNGPLQIQWDGTVVPCCYDYNNAMPLGNAFRQPIAEILAGPAYYDLRDAHRTGQFHRVPYCDQCDQLLEHPDALVYSNRHDLPAAEAVKLSNTDLYNLDQGRPIDPARTTRKTP
jgi:hypothetical protein